MKFRNIVGNPPYQIETSEKSSNTKGEASKKNIFHHFQTTADEVSDGLTSLIYPGDRWLLRTGKGTGFKEFAFRQINCPTLTSIDYYPDSKQLFRNVDVPGGITIVLKDKNKTTPGFEYTHHRGEQKRSCTMNHPGLKLPSLNPRDDSIIQRVETFIKKHNFTTLNHRIHSRSLFGIESDFVEKNPDKVEEYSCPPDIDYATKIKLFTNHKAGKAGRSRWYIADRSIIRKNPQYIDKWQVIVSSANAGGKKRQNQIEIVDNHSAFGRSRIALASFETEQEAQNFRKYAQAYLIRFLFLLTGDDLTSLGKKVPDIGDYSNNNRLIGFSTDINIQLYNSIGLQQPEIGYVEHKIKAIDASRTKKF